MSFFSLKLIFEDRTDFYPKFYWPCLFSYYRETTLITTLLDEPIEPPKPMGISSLFGNSGKYNIKMDSYKNKISEYNQHEQKRYQLWDEYNNVGNYQELHALNLREIIKGTKKAAINFPNPSVGILESKFGELLKAKFNDKIFTNRIVEINNDGHNYVPDFVFHDSVTNIHIDIEIDEPYVLKTGKPTHYLYKTRNGQRSIDLNRDLWFTKRGWFVLRFCEQQILKNPEDCIVLIENLFYSLRKLISQNVLIFSPSKVENIKPWTIIDSMSLFKNKYRERLYNIQCASTEPMLDKTDINFLNETKRLDFVDDKDDLPF
jgi:hypothetical protein